MKHPTTPVKCENDKYPWYYNNRFYDTYEKAIIEFGIDMIDYSSYLEKELLKNEQRINRYKDQITDSFGHRWSEKTNENLS